MKTFSLQKKQFSWADVYEIKQALLRTITKNIFQVKISLVIELYYETSKRLNTLIIFIYSWLLEHKLYNYVASKTAIEYKVV